jgi:hypothetical protein
MTVCWTKQMWRGYQTRGGFVVGQINLLIITAKSEGNSLAFLLLLASLSLLRWL